MTCDFFSLVQVKTFATKSFVFLHAWDWICFLMTPALVIFLFSKLHTIIAHCLKIKVSSLHFMCVFKFSRLNVLRAEYALWCKSTKYSTHFVSLYKYLVASSNKLFPRTSFRCVLISMTLDQQLNSHKSFPFLPAQKCIEHVFLLLVTCVGSAASADSVKLSWWMISNKS